MKTVIAALALTLPAGAALAHEAGAVAHIHPHGGEAVLAALAVMAGVAVLWWRSRRG
ncbi:hypothetical protein [Roseicyclus persicicus]|uniref:Peptidase M23 n=1 Tax=Roseicyclus persicicus TaxID=2650661 RepID=A0A7X6GYT2_9RHOB|nr:hypothetical protein [Roseibacterium persicicum]NKX43751.1 hypothetical protein [Roseibacterium persicicum]